MANILQVTSTEVSAGNNPAIRPGIGNGTQVGGAGRVKGGGQLPNTAEAGLSKEELSGQVADFESNYVAFIQKMQGSNQLAQQLGELLFRDGEMLLKSGDAELSAAIQELYATITMEDPEQLMNYLQSQAGGQMKYTGEFFDGLRQILGSKISENYQNAILSFIKSYNSYSAGTHLLNQMKTLGQDATNLMMKSYRGEFEELLGKINWEATNGDTEENTQIINNDIIPFLSKYVAKTHDYGPIRKAAVMFTLYAIKYEEGSEKEMVETFRKMSRNGDFRMMFEGDPEHELVDKLTQLKSQIQTNAFSDQFSELLLKGTQGKTGAESIDRYYQVLNSLLMNESVYMPILHMLIPFRYQNKNVMSEMWVDPDADKKNDNSTGTVKKVKLFLKFNIESLGGFDLIAQLKNKNIDMQLFVPDTVKENPKKIEATVKDIMKRNGLMANVTMSPKVREIGVQEVFPEIRESERGINVRI
jgi:hypothetical protein